MENIKSTYTSDIKDVDNMNGLEFEEFCCELFKRNGYSNVKKTQASGDYGLDVIATTPDGFICGIQCKNYQNSVGIAAVQEAKTGSDYYNCDIAIVLTNSTFTKQAIEMAREIKVKLWDRDKLEELLLVFPQKANTSKNSVNVTQNDSVTIEKLEDWIKKHGYVLFSFKQLCSNILKHNEFNIFKNISSTPNAKYILAERADIKYHICCNFEDIKENPVSEELAEKIVKDLISKQRQDVVNIESRSVILTNGFFTKGAAEKAKEKRVILWDRNKLAELLKNYPITDFISDCDYIKKIIDNNLEIEKRRQEREKEEAKRREKMGCIAGLACIVIVIFAIWGLFHF